MRETLSRTDGMEEIPMPDADVRFLENLYAPCESAALRERLMQEVDWRQESILLWGKRHLQPRLCAWYGDAGSAYRYSGTCLQPNDWTMCLQGIREDVERATGCRFNSVLVNLYRDHHDSIGWHSDDEVLFGEEPAIASLSLGETRIFRMRHKTRRELGRIDLSLTDGSLLLMSGGTQRHWQHAIDKERRACGPRINLTFRQVVRTA